MEVEYKNDQYHPRTLANGTDDLEEEFEVSFRGKQMKKDLGGPEVCEFVLRFGRDVSVLVVGQWLYNRLEEMDAESIKIGSEEVEVHKELIKEKIEKYAEN